jgi:type VI secretion system protein ImpJ
VFVSKKVVWKEGLFLQPQHFQQFERFLTHSVQTRFSSYIPYHFGFTEYVINNDTIANGAFSVTKAQGIMPDGTYFNIPKQDTSPPVRPFEDHFAIDQQSLDVFFSVPMIAENKVNVCDSTESKLAMRYSNQKISVTDEVYGKQKKEIEVAGYNFEILFGDESRDDYSSMQIARLVRTSNNQIVNDESYVPPLLHLSASYMVMNKIRSLIELLHAKSTSLSQGRRVKEGGFAEFASSEQTVFSLLYTINTYTPLLNYHHFVPEKHPYDLFLFLLQFTGSLCSFSSQIKIKMLPKYEHTNIYTVFSTYDRLIRKILGADISAGCVNIPIEQVGPANYLCKVRDDSLFSVGEFYFCVAGDISKKELIVGTLSRIKMCSRDKLELLIPSAMPGLPLIHTSRPPQGLSTKPGFVYFKLDQRGPFWDGIKTSGTIAFYFPHHYRDLQMEMLALKS